MADFSFFSLWFFFLFPIGSESLIRLVVVSESVIQSTSQKFLWLKVFKAYFYLLEKDHCHNVSNRRLQIAEN